MTPDQNFGNIRFRNRIFVKIPINGDSKNSGNFRINKAENDFRKSKSIKNFLRVIFEKFGKRLKIS